MPNFLVASARLVFFDYADACCFEFEDTIINSLQADLLEFQPPSQQKQPDIGNGDFSKSTNYDVVFLVANSFQKLAKMLDMLDTYQVSAKATYAYVFGAYKHGLKYISLPGARKIIPRYRRIAKVDHIFAPIMENIPSLSEIFDTEVHYSPMAVDVLKVSGQEKNRFISVNGFGRQEPGLSNLLANSFNKPGSPYFYHHTMAIHSSGLKDWKLYRDMFWHSLRNSQLSLTFDNLYYNPGNRAKHSFVGPRWYESLATGSVIVGQAPKTAEAKALLDWKDATIDLPEDPQKALKVILSMLESPEKLREIGQNNIQQMHLKHDWRYRISKMLLETGLPPVASLDEQIQKLKSKSRVDA